MRLMFINLPGVDHTVGLPHEADRTTLRDSMTRKVN
jgi:hypothetical protein